MESGNTAMILKRDILSGGMKVPFKFVIEAIELVEITVTCHHHIFTASPRFQKLHSQLPDWSIRQLKEKASRSYGDLKLVKKVNISQSKWLGIF